MLNCIYHPTEEMRVVDNDEYERLLKSGFWFAHPNDAKKMREKYENELRLEQKPRSKKAKQASKHDGEHAQSK